MQDFTPEQQRNLAAAPPERLWNGLVGSILTVKKNHPMALVLLERMLRTDVPISEIIDTIGDPETDQPFDLSSHPTLRQALTKALSYRRNQLRMAANAMNN